ncbi:MAG: hypothetical protein JXR96_20995, partial [Deltaproteobacteria bacterium]|nr:hypothetical protein [Deltaproteobacteria bacterium]
MRAMMIVLAALAAFCLAACGTTTPLTECDTSADCTGDPGIGCEWRCTDHNCEAYCPPECESASDCTGDPGTGCVWACVDGSCTPDCEPECE